MCKKLFQRVSQVESSRDDRRSKEGHLVMEQCPMQKTLDFSVCYPVSSYEPCEVLIAHFIGKVP